MLKIAFTPVLLARTAPNGVGRVHAAREETFA